MKTLTDMAEQERVSLQKDVFWLVELILPDQVMRYASRPITLDGKYFQPKLIRLESLLHEFQTGKSFGRSSAVVVMCNLESEGDDRLREIARLTPLQGREVNISVFFRDALGLAGIDDVIPVARLNVASVDFTPATAKLSLVDPIRYKEKEAFLRSLTPAELPDLETGEELPLPVVFGAVKECPLTLLPYVRGMRRRTRLDGELSPGADYLVLEEAEGLPLRGRLQVGDEVLEYRVLDKEARRAGSEQSPLVRPEAGYHPDGTDVRFLPEGGLHFVAADHACLDLKDLRAEERPLDDSQWQVENESLFGREACLAWLQRWPCLVKHASGSSTLRINGAASPGCWEATGDNTALDPDRASDGFPGVTFSRIDETHNKLSLKFRKNLSNGFRQYGILRRAAVEVHYFSPACSVARSNLFMKVKKAGDTLEGNLAWPGSDSMKGIASEERITLGSIHSPGEEGLFPPFPENSMITPFDEILGDEDLGGGNYRWKDAQLAGDGDFDSYTVNFSGPSVSSNSEPLVLLLHRRPMLDTAARLTRVNFHAVMDSHGTPQKNVRVRIRIADRYNGDTVFLVDGRRREYAYEVPVSGVTFEHLVDHVTNFQVETPDGSKLRVYEAWLELYYCMDWPGDDYSGEGSEESQIEAVVESLEVNLPSPRLCRGMDITQLMQQEGGWECLDGGEDAPALEIAFSGLEEAVFITDVALVLEYSSRVGADILENLTATVSGVCEQGALVENPADVIRHILTGKNFLDFSDDNIDEESFENIKTGFTNSGEVVSQRLSGSKESGKVLEEILNERGLRLVCDGGKFRLLRQRWNPSKLGETLDVDFSIGKQMVLNAEPVMEDANSLELVLPHNAICLERGDRLSIQFKNLGLERALGELSRFEYSELDQWAVGAAITQRGEIFWHKDEDTLLRHLDGAEGIVFYIFKKAVARLDKGGHLCILGELIEEALGTGEIDSPITFDVANKRLLFGTGPQAPHSVIFAIDQYGNLLTRGELIEGTVPQLGTVEDFSRGFEKDGENWFVLTLDKKNPQLVGQESTGNLYLKGEVREG